jgi:hypothetical protein
MEIISTIAQQEEYDHLLKTADNSQPADVGFLGYNTQVDTSVLEKHTDSIFKAYISLKQWYHPTSPHTVIAQKPTLTS